VALMMVDGGIQQCALRMWIACAFLFVLGAFEAFLDAPRDLILATIVAFILCAALFVLLMLRYIGYRTYDIVRFVIMGGVFVFVLTTPYPFHWQIAIYFAIMIPLNLIYLDRGSGSN
jgi:hypothetical protein